MPITEAAVREVMAVLLADVHHVMGRGELVHHADGIAIAGVVQVPALQYADAGDAEIVHQPVQAQALVGPLLLFVVVDVGVAGVPAGVRQVRPTLQGQFQIDGLALGDVEMPAQRGKLGASFHQNLRHPHRHVDGELAVAVKRRRARPDL